jgi:hypothetical protein
VKPRGRIDSVTAAVGDMAGALRRRREGREARVRLYDLTGAMIAVDPAGEQAGVMLDKAADMLDLTDVAGRKPA